MKIENGRVDPYSLSCYNDKMTNTESLLEAQKEIHQKMAKMREELKTLGEKLFKEGSQDIFDTFPEVKSFSWTQYTPYFNDGDECVFRVNDWFEVKLENGEELEEVSYSEYYRQRKLDRGEEFTLEDNLGMALDSLLGGVDDDTMKALFGDHARVTVSREGIEVEHYDHD